MRSPYSKDIIKNYIINNYREYILIGILFFIGLFIGVLIVNNAPSNQMSEISLYIKDFITKFKHIQDFDNGTILVSSIRNNIVLVLILWFAGTTVIGMPIVLALILFRGVALGYTISAITCTLGTLKGIIFCLTSILLQNVLFIPAIITIGVSSMKLYKSIIRDKRRENIKIEIIKHIAMLGLMIILIVISSVIESFISTNILKKFIKYF